jgi:polysaccharide biosynthesis protein PslH
LKNILFLTHLYPYPPDDGGRIVTFNTIKELQKFGHNIFLCCFTEEGKNNQKLPLDIYCTTVPFSYGNSYSSLLKNVFENMPYNMQKYISSEMEDEIKKVLSKYKIDLVYIDHLHMAYYAKLIKEHYPDVKVILRQHNVESTIFERAVSEEANPLKKAYLKLQYKKLYKYESDITNLFEKIYTITEEDKTRLFEMNNKVSISNLPAGVDTEKYYPMETPKNDEPTIVFLGTMSWLPNINGIEWFIKEIFPLILKEFPNLKLYIVGKNPPQKLIKYQKDNNKNIIITGYVEDERPYIAKSDAFIVPLKIGGGMRIKILNALAMKKTIVTTSVGVEGIHLSKNSLLVADTPSEFASSILKVLKDERLSNEISTSGLKDVKQDYSNESILYSHAQEIEKLY